ncbi:hypothetical protein HZC30_02940 [Candidatus Woesearchaeota archaeon]|nr:hypothetical protein [Candidatus Woesearchaeota archaeon]
MDVKKSAGLLVLLVLISSTFAASDTTDNCAGVWGSIKCFLWGNPANRAGKGWWDRTEALVGN